MKKLLFIVMLVMPFIVLPHSFVYKMKTWTDKIPVGFILFRTPLERKGWLLLAATPEETCNVSEKKVDKLALKRATDVCNFLGASLAVPPKYEDNLTEKSAITLYKNEIKGIGYYTRACHPKRGRWFWNYPKILTEIICMR